MTCPVMLSQPIPFHVQHSWPIQDESLLEGSTIPFLKVRRASLSPLLQSTFGLPPAYEFGDPHGLGVFWGGLLATLEPLLRVTRRKPRTSGGQEWRVATRIG
jgi:hypothetical protein